MDVLSDPRASESVRYGPAMEGARVAPIPSLGGHGSSLEVVVRAHQTKALALTDDLSGMLSADNASALRECANNNGVNRLVLAYPETRKARVTRCHRHVG